MTTVGANPSCPQSDSFGLIKTKMCSIEEKSNFRLLPPLHSEFRANKPRLDKMDETLFTVIEYMPDSTVYYFAVGESLLFLNLNKFDARHVCLGKKKVRDISNKKTMQ